MQDYLPYTANCASMGSTNAPSGPRLARGYLGARRYYLAAFIAISLTSSAIAAVYYRSFRNALLDESADKLELVAYLKIEDIQRWRRERLGDVQVLALNPTFAKLAERALRSPSDRAARYELGAWLAVFLPALGYDRAALLSRDGREVVSAPESGGPICEEVRSDIPQILRAGIPVLHDLHMSDSGGARYTVVAPIRRASDVAGTGAEDASDGSDGGDAARRAIGLVALRGDPRHYLYPLIARWPTPSRTAETLLTRREGDRVVFLNDLRFRTGSALRHSLPMSRTDAPSVMAALGKRGAVLGRDYRRVPVQAYVIAVPDTNWHLTARVDLSEVYEPATKTAGLLASGVVLLLAASGFALMTLWNRQRAAALRQELEATKALQEGEQRYRTDLERSERRFRTLAESMAEGVAMHEIIKDASGAPVDYRINYVNPAYSKHTGLQADGVVGRTATEVYSGAPPFLHEYARVAETGEPCEIETYFEPLRRHYRISAVCPAPGTFATVFEDITERIRREQDLADRTAEMERFTYAASHDLRSPLVTVTTFLGYLKEELAAGNTESALADMGYIEAAADKMGRLLDELLHISRVGRVASEPTPTSFRRIVEEALGAVAGPIAERGVAVHLQDGDVEMYGDAARLVEVWQNLIENAVKFMGKQASPRIELGFVGTGRATVFHVRDNGVGIAPQHRSRVFGLFDKLDPRSPGTGMGLALVKRIVELHGGSIEIESATLDGGASFIFCLPDAMQPPPNTERRHDA